MTILNYSANMRNFLSCFGKNNDYGSQFSFSPVNLRNEGFSLWVLRTLIFEGTEFYKFRGKGNGESFRESRKLAGSISVVNLRVLQWYRKNKGR